MEGLHFAAALKDLQDFLMSVSYCADPCLKDNIKDDIGSIQTWLDQFKNMPAFISKVSTNYFIHYKVIKADISHEKADWAAGNYFNAGTDMADIVTLALGPMSDEPVPVYEYHPTMA